MLLLNKSSDSVWQYRFFLVIASLFYFLFLPSPILAVTCEKCNFDYDHETYTFCPRCFLLNDHLQHDTTPSQSATSVNPYLYAGPEGDESWRGIQSCDCGSIYRLEDFSSCPICPIGNEYLQLNNTSTQWATPVNPDSNPGVQSDESQRSLQLAINLFSNVAEGMTTNLVISPDGLFQSLALILMGATGETQQLLQNCLGNSFSEQYGAAASSATFCGQDQYCVANCILVSHESQLQETYRDRVRQINVAIRDNVNFSNPASLEQLARELNKLFCELTRGMIPFFCNARDWGSSHLVALINSVYFMGLWDKPFRTRSKGEFTLPNNQRVILDKFLSGEIRSSQYASQNDWQAVTVFYHGAHEMILVLPPEGIMPQEVTPEIITALFSSLDSEEADPSSSTISLELPPFKVDSETDLNKALSQAGLSFLFEKASLGNMLTLPAPLNSMIFSQHCAMEVNEAGTRAAAVTRSRVLRGFGREPGESITFNRPFLYILRNIITKKIIFIGQILDPGNLGAGTSVWQTH
ncbi:serpin family protein [Endozoicomonas sp. ONNA1]|uniref:serpin family protein n=1 Tax=Endozoicomonas sp. ONNA1 TaxID=2828740 RepID=UPI0021478D73